MQLNATLAQTTSLLQRRNKELDEFAYVASHDLKAPLRAIANLSEWIEDDLAGQLPEENQQQLQLLRQRVYRMEQLINGLLTYSRIGRTQPTLETIQVSTLLAEVIDSISPPPTFNIEISPNMPTLTTKPILLSQVFSNLINNAIKHHNRPDGCIKISAEDQGEFYEFAVADDGPGIAPENYNKIFVIFQTLYPSETNDNTGIGLSIVKKIVETEGGSIRVDSSPGQGATFRFSWRKRAK
jgi:light-regulated signal transduction histidine kinase (bacteriophytochrome)